LEWEIYFGKLHRYEILERIMDLKNFLSVWVFTHSDEKKTIATSDKFRKNKRPTTNGSFILGDLLPLFADMEPLARFGFSIS
jgi:hypothetical protein